MNCEGVEKVECKWDKRIQELGLAPKLTKPSLLAERRDSIAHK